MNSDRDRTSPAVVVVLAAGEGTRMKSSLSKVLHPILGKPILGHVMDAAIGVDPDHIVVVVGHQRERVVDYLADQYPSARTAVQAEQNGTGHAVRCALKELAQAGIDVRDGAVVVLGGDTPLLRTSTIAALVEHQAQRRSAVTVLSAELDDPTGYGRIVRDMSGDVTGIVEDKDASDTELMIKEINSGVYSFDYEVLNDALGRLSTENSQGEEYLTDVVGIARGDGRPVSAYIAPDSLEVNGINDRKQLASGAAILRDRTNEDYMRAGVTIVDPATTWIAPGARIAADAVIERNSSIDSLCSIAAGATVGPDTTLVATSVGNGAHVLKSHCLGAEIGAGANIGPFSYLRPGTRLGTGSKVGAYVEVKNSHIGTDSKVPHLSYVGDAYIGIGTNIGAATVFVNYDGVNKHHTVVGDHVRVGSDSMLIAPVTIGDGAYTAAGSVITNDVPAGAIGIGRSRQVNKEHWVEHNRPDTQSASVAARAKISPSDPAVVTED